jgi:acetoacetyl-CoA synthetase
MRSLTESGTATRSQLAEFTELCEERTGLTFDSPQQLDAFSVAEYRRFWSFFLEWADPLREGVAEPVCTDDRCEEAIFFPNLRLNYAENLLVTRSDGDDERIALIARHGSGPTQRLSRRELRQRVRTLAAHMRSLGVEAGDRVAAIAPNNAEAVVGGLAAATIGATFSSAAPDMGAPAILSRFEQLRPKLLLATFGGEDAQGGASDRIATVASSLPSLVAVIALDDCPAEHGLSIPVLALSDLLASPASEPLDEGWQRFPFNHPLFVLFTSGTTGPPKCIVHGAGGTLLEHLKEHRLHCDLRPDDTLFFHTTAAWMMWNWQLSALASGTPIVLFDGSLEGAGTLWQIVAEEGVSVFGTSPPYLQMCAESGYSPKRNAPADRLRAVLSTGSVLRDRQFDWVAEEVGDVPLQSISGGTDIVGCFVLGNPELPVRRGMIQCRSLGLDVKALSTDETPAGSPVGELICRNPFPSRPLGFLDDPDGKRFHEAYFAANEGVWTHGDLIEFDDDGQARIHGRSDGVLNVHGVRIGPAEIYRALAEVPELREAMAVEQEHAEGSRLVLLVILRDGEELDGDLVLRIRRRLMEDASALHVPELVVAVGELPVTHSGKRSERAGSDAVNGREVANRGALANPESLDGIARAVVLAEEARADREQAAASEDAPTVERLRAIWEAVLGVEPLADDDDFFAVGGTSLLAVRMFHMVAARIDRELPLSTLLEAPTLAELAAVIDDPARRTGRLVLMRRGSGAPLFLVHSLWGDVLGMRQLARAIESDIPVYGLRARGLDPDEEPQASVEELARTYVKTVRTVQPEGPYRVAGHSFGALVAFELARKLEEDGAEVGWLGLIDGELSTACLPPALRWRYRAALPFHMARAALANPRGAAHALFREAIPNLWRRTGGRRAAPSAALAEEPPASWMEGVAPHYQRLAGTFLAASEAFRPRPYPGAITYFVPEVRRFHLYADPLPVWRRVAEGGLELEPVPGPHVGMVSGERAAIVAAGIDAGLGRNG